jgi:glutathione S-transferase
MATQATTDATTQDATKPLLHKITLHWLNSSRAHRILWLLEELNLPYELKTYSRQPDMLAPSELKKIHPLGKAPLLTVSRPDSPENPLVLVESAVIVEYLLDHWGNNLIPKRYREGLEGQPGGETDEWQRYRHFMHYAEGSLMPYMLIALLLSRMYSQPLRLLSLG